MTDENESLRRGFETFEAKAKGIFIVAAVLVVAAIVMGILVTAYFNELKGRLVDSKKVDGQRTLTAQKPMAPGPHLQVDEAGDLQSYLERENKVLTSYGWVDKQKQIVHIPVDRAIEMLTTGEGGAP